MLPWKCNLLPIFEFKIKNKELLTKQYSSTSNRKHRGSSSSAPTIGDTRTIEVISICTCLSLSKRNVNQIFEFECGFLGKERESSALAGDLEFSTQQIRGRGSSQWAIP